jgi:hypothetical protein
LHTANDRAVKILIIDPTLNGRAGDSPFDCAICMRPSLACSALIGVSRWATATSARQGRKAIDYFASYATINLGEGG